MLELFLITTSLHLDNGRYNEFNPGIVARYDSAVVGVYKNSFSEVSALVGISRSWAYGNIEYGVIAGGVTGYDVDWTINGVTPFVAPFVTYRTETISPTVLVLGSAVTLSFRVEF